MIRNGIFKPNSLNCDKFLPRYLVGWLFRQKIKSSSALYKNPVTQQRMNLYDFYTYCLITEWLNIYKLFKQICIDPSMFYMPSERQDVTITRWS